jgi:GGDEF domain-containing protein
MIKKFNAGSHPFKLSMSIGAATPEAHDEKLETLLFRADKEMYEDKLLRKQQEQPSTPPH